MTTMTDEEVVPGRLYRALLPVFATTVVLTPGAGELLCDGKMDLTTFSGAVNVKTGNVVFLVGDNILTGGGRCVIFLTEEKLAILQLYAFLNYFVPAKVE